MRKKVLGNKPKHEHLSIKTLETYYREEVGDLEKIVILHDIETCSICREKARRVKHRIRGPVVVVIQAL